MRLNTFTYTIIVGSDYIVQSAIFSAFNETAISSFVILSDIEKRIKEKIEKIGTPLKDWDIQINYGIKTGYNEAFIIDGKTREELIEKSKPTDLSSIIRPILRGRDIKKYGYEFADLWLINTHNGTSTTPAININDYPFIKEYLDKFYTQLSKRQDKGNTPYNLRSCAYMDDFSKQKIAWNRIASEKLFAYIDKDIFIQDSMHFFTGNHLKFLCSILNSKLFVWLMNLIVGKAAGGNAGNADNVKNLTIPIPSFEQEQQIEKLLQEKDYQAIDKLVYEMYNLDKNEIDFINFQ